MNIGDTVRILGTLAIGTVREVHPWDVGVDLANGYFGYFRHEDLEPGTDLRSEIARLPPRIWLATLDGVRVQEGVIVD